MSKQRAKGTAAETAEVTYDIVTELRQQARAEKLSFPRTFLMAAAIEIERLRSEVNLWIGVAERFAESETAQHHHNAIEYYRKAVRGE